MRIREEGERIDSDWPTKAQWSCPPGPADGSVRLWVSRARRVLSARSQGDKAGLPKNWSILRFPLDCCWGDRCSSEELCGSGHTDKLFWLEPDKGLQWVGLTFSGLHSLWIRCYRTQWFVDLKSKDPLLIPFIRRTLYYLSHQIQAQLWNPLLHFNELLWSLLQLFPHKPVYNPPFLHQPVPFLDSLSEWVNCPSDCVFHFSLEVLHSLILWIF